MQEPKEFLITAVDTLKKSGFCWLCGRAMRPGVRIAICRYGNGERDWEKAHEQCAKDHALNGEREGVSISGALTVSWRELDEYTGRNRYELSIDGVPVIRTSARDKATGMVELLNQHPEAAEAIVSSVHAAAA